MVLEGAEGRRACRCMWAMVWFCVVGLTDEAEAQPPDYAGSSSCRACHERFYELWSTSHHGLAMQPMSAALAGTALTPPSDAVRIGEVSYRADLSHSPAAVQELGPDGEKSYPIAHAMGGKNVYYFLTELERGMLQVLPVAYDVREKAWFDTAASGMRHAAGHPNQPVHWRDRPYTFNTSCYACHVSQLSTNYDPATDSYRTTWAEPGINCETCHGPSAEHARAFREAPADHPPADLGLISTKAMTTQQRNELCAPCHAKMTPITPSFRPGDRFLDHYGLTTLEDPDFHPDGRDLGENYTYTSWLMSPCVKSGQLDCMHCHTSSGRYRFADPANANGACLPCHEDHVANPAAHTRHKNDGTGGRCVSCHMPKTSFARMVRSDHSMRPPMPAATMAFGSPNACNICHTDKDAGWADGLVREWRSRDYQAPVLRVARLIDDARKRDWTRLSEMLSYVESDHSDEVFRASLVRLMGACDDSRAWMIIIDAVRDPSPLVRAAASHTLDGYLVPDALISLLKATRDDYRLVRVRAAAALAPVPPDTLGPEDRDSLSRALAEFEASLRSRPDDYASHYNLGNYHADLGDPARALEEYEAAMRLNAGFAPIHVNASLALSRLGRNDEAEKALRKALALDPASAPAHFNLGLLLAELGRTSEAEATLREALKADPRMAEAAYNLGILLAQQRKPEGLEWCRQAWELRPTNADYGYTLAFYQHQAGDAQAAARTLEATIGRHPGHVDAYALLGRIYEEQKDWANAAEVYRRAAALENLDPDRRAALAARAEALSRN